jgi:hypothetical protein
VDHSRILSGFELAPVVNYNSGHPFNLLAGADINGNNHFINDRPRGSPRNSNLGPNCVDFDATLSRAFKFGDRYNLLLDHTSNDEPRSFWPRAANPSAVTQHRGPCCSCSLARRDCFHQQRKRLLEALHALIRTFEVP